MLLPLYQAASSLAILTLAASCGTNMIQTRRIMNQCEELDTDNNNGWNNKAEEEMVTSLTTAFEQSSSSSSSPAVVQLTQTQTNDDIVNQLQQMNRKNLLQVFKQSSTPTSLSDIEGDWDAILLDNNGFIMTTISNMMTHILFGRGRRWIGKSFNEQKGYGRNRFVAKNNNRHGENIIKRTNEEEIPTTTATTTATTTTDGVQTEHSFQYSITESSLDKESSAVKLVYSKYQSPLSLWKTMVDEVRIVPASNGNVLIGIGSMKWSGGMLNGSPFCLWRTTTK